MNRADITIATLEVSALAAGRFGVFTVDDDSRVTAFTEKPAMPETIPGKSTCFAPMTIAAARTLIRMSVAAASPVAVRFAAL